MGNYMSARAPLVEWSILHSEVEQLGEDSEMALGESSGIQVARCTKNPNHRTMTPVEHFNIESLPPEWQTPRLVHFIKATARRTVKVIVPFISSARPDKYPMWRHRGKYKMYAGSGFSFIDRSFLEKPCIECKVKDCPIPRPHLTTPIFEVRTARHVIFDDLEGRGATVEFFYDSDDRCTVVTAQVIGMAMSTTSGDTSVIDCTTPAQPSDAPLQSPQPHLTTQSAASHPPAQSDSSLTSTQSDPSHSFPKPVTPQPSSKTTSYLPHISTHPPEKNTSEDIIVQCVSHDLSLFKQVCLDDQELDPRAQVACLPQHDGLPLVLIVSHPHGHKKQVSLGQLTGKGRRILFPADRDMTVASFLERLRKLYPFMATDGVRAPDVYIAPDRIEHWEEMVRQNAEVKCQDVIGARDLLSHICYTAATCPGSSGAAVFVFPDPKELHIDILTSHSRHRKGRENISGVVNVFDQRDRRI